MNNFNSIFEELNKLYEEDNQKAKDNGKNASEPNKAKPEQPEKDPMHEAAEEEIAVEEVPEEVEAAAQLVLECAKCGAITIKPEAEVVVDEETGIANVEETCQYCEAEEGHKVIGTFTPYEEDDTLDEGLKKVKKGEQEKYRRVTYKEVKKGDYVMEEPRDMTSLPVKIIDVKRTNSPESGEWIDLFYRSNGQKLSFTAEPFEHIAVFDTVDLKARKAALKDYEKHPEDYDYIGPAGDEYERGPGYFQKKIAEALEAGSTLEEACKNLAEDIADWYRRKFDRPASIATQQAWEAELNGEMGEIDDKRRAHLERKFAQQRDWEARHPDKEVK